MKNQKKRGLFDTARLSGYLLYLCNETVQCGGSAIECRCHYIQFHVSISCSICFELVIWVFVSYFVSLFAI